VEALATGTSSFALAPGLHRDSSLRFDSIASHAKRSEDHSAQCSWEAVSVLPSERMAQFLRPPAVSFNVAPDSTVGSET
jgi:hypothetical protein